MSRPTEAVLDDYTRKMREREAMVREADARVASLEAEARDRAEMSRKRQTASISERAKHVAELERTRVAEGFYDPQRLARMQDERKVNPARLLAASSTTLQKPLDLYGIL